MPYIKRVNRPQYKEDILNVIELIPADEDMFSKAEHLGYFFWTVLNRYAPSVFDEEGYEKIFSSIFWDGRRRHLLEGAGERVAATLMNNRDLCAEAGDLNYIFSATSWGILGDSEHHPEANYAFRTYLKSILLSLIDIARKSSDNASTRTSKMIYAVLDDVVTETYRRKTSGYEDKKIEENGDVWPL